MPSNMEIRVMQKTTLFDLLKLKKDGIKAGKDVADLEYLIVKTEAAMEAEDVAWVEKKVAQLTEKNGEQHGI